LQKVKNIRNEKTLFLNIVIPFYCSILFAQNKQPKDSTIILPGDIYSNFSKENYNRTKPVSFIIDKNKDSIRILGVGYTELIAAGDKFYNKKDFLNAANYYVKAFKANSDLGTVDDRLKTACCFSMLNNKDSAFVQLFRIVVKGHYTNLTELNSIEYLKPLYQDKRWQEVISLITKNRNELLEKMNKEIPESGLPAETNQ